MGVVLAAALVALPVRALVNTIDVAMWLLLAVVIVAARSSRGPALLASALAIVTFDVMFVPPYYRLTVDDTDYLFSFGVMLAVATLMSGLTTRIRQQAVEAATREHEARARADLNQALTVAESPAAVIEVVRARLSELLGAPGRILPVPPVSEAAAPAWPDDPLLRDTETRLAATWTIHHGEAAGWGTRHGGEAEALVLPLRTTQGTTAVLLFPAGPQPPPSEERLRLAGVLLEQGCLALDRAMMAERHEAARLAVEAEQLRTALLSALSHDLRTPLASIEGAASSLLEDDAVLQAADRRELAEGILSESRRMHRLVANLLDMVRVETGSLAVQPTWQPLEEALGVALLRLEERLADREVTTDLTPDLPLVPIDEILIEQVFINLLDNTLRHTPPGTPITIAARRDEQHVMVEILDRGPGIPAGEEGLVFGKFYQVRSADHPSPTGGAGLGLAICRGIVHAHGGRIWVENRPGGGAAFRFTLPVTGAPSREPAEAAEG